MVHVIGAGLPRTGTSSMKAALDRIGFAPTYHMFELLSHPEHIPRWEHAVADGPVDWDYVLEGYRAGVDWPFSHFWRELAAAYPRAKVVLNHRDPHRWYRSMSATLFGFLPVLRGETELASTGGGADTRRLMEVVRLQWISLFGHCEHVPDEAEAVAAYERHRAAVIEAVPADRLLVYELGQGWEPLCGFLGAAVPDTPFPHLNETDAMHRVMDDLRRGRPVTAPF
ncbi:sulfotransferase family protein [Streptomonospora algeriensis]|uniref:Sulfotransferase family protein n=1 Tax=Streptomonospora algeriensis TaxID=995084 RepID=A0ABW3BKP7_9ACTN